MKVLLFCLGCGALRAATPAATITASVNPFIGTAWTVQPTGRPGFDCGNTFPGAVYPMGMVQWSPDTPAPKAIKGGYFYPDQTITGFPLTHFSGRGVTYLQDLAFLPTVKAVESSPGSHWADYAAAFSHQHEDAHPGYYGVRLDNGIHAEFTVTPRTGFARIAFPAEGHRTILWRTDSHVAIEGKDALVGFHSANIGGAARSYTVYFAARFNRAFSRSGTWSGDALNVSPATGEGRESGAFVSFDGGGDATVQVKVGVSFVSSEGAKANLDAENPGWDFDRTRAQADAAWEGMLGRIRVEGGSSGDTRKFYTALYHCFMHPNLLNDADGRYPGMDGRLHTAEAGRNQYQNIPAWDQYRSFAALRAIITPRETSDIAQSLVNYAQQDAEVRPAGGGLPRWEQVNHNSGGMVGDGDDAIIAAAHAFGARDFDTRAALAAMDKGASVPGTTSDGFPVRAGLEDYSALGFVPSRGSVTLEYCMADFALSQFAGALGDRARQIAYQNRAQNWRNLYNAGTGLLEPRAKDRSFKPGTTPASTTGFTEGSAAQYLWLINFDSRGLFDLLGGNERVVARLDEFFKRINGPNNSANAFMGNEPGEGSPWAYAFAGAPEKTQQVVRRIQQELFLDLPSGLPGNDDAGALSSWYVFSAIGLFPAIPGVGGMVVGSPVFPSVAIALPGARPIRIESARAAADAPYVQSLSLNGAPWNSPWIPWSSLSGGAQLKFVLGPSPSTWGHAAEGAPPSFGRIESH